VYDSDARGQLKLLHRFYDAKLCGQRVVTDLHWSPKHPELVLASYNENPTAPQAARGQVLVWSLHLPDRPEYVFEAQVRVACPHLLAPIAVRPRQAGGRGERDPCPDLHLGDGGGAGQSRVLTARFHPYEPHLILGGTYAGQLLLWDVRARSLPVDKSALSFEGHTHPVYQVEIVGTPNAHTGFSVSTDGVACVWALDRLAVPAVRPTHPPTQTQTYTGHVPTQACTHA
jgi:dynein intermediate chain, cytosolic